MDGSLHFDTSVDEKNIDKSRASIIKKFQSIAKGAGDAGKKIAATFTGTIR